MMSMYNAVGIAEGFVQAESEDEYIQAWQFLLDTGYVWQLQGWFGRTASKMIEDGILTWNNPPYETN